MRSGINGMAPDTPWLPAGTGMDIRRNCMGCNAHKSQVGGNGKKGVWWRCAACVAKKAAEKAGKADQK